MKRRFALMLTAGVVLALCGACGVWLHTQRQQYARNRQLIAALSHDDTITALALVHAGADPNTRYSSTSAPSLPQLLKQLLHRSPHENGTATAFMFACAGQDVSLHTQYLHSEELPQHIALVQAMLRHDANVRLHDELNRSALVYAVSRNRLHTTELLLERGASVNEQDKLGMAPLHWAAMTSSTAIMRQLLAHHADVNLQDMSTGTPLHYAVMWGSSQDIVRQLLAHGADPKRPNRYSQTPIMLAQGQRPTDILLLLTRSAK